MPNFRLRRLLAAIPVPDNTAVPIVTIMGLAMLIGGVVVTEMPSVRI
jgi:hypothetical protein